MHDNPVAPKLNILVVDDNEAALLAIQQALSGLGQNLVLARSGKEAFRALLKQDFAVILLDVRMPDMDGFETASLIRRREKTEHTPIIFVTAFAHDETEVAKGYALGAADYIFAPIVPAILRAKVSAYIEIKRQAERILQLELQERESRLAVARENLEEQIKRNLFFTLSLDLLCIIGFDGWFRQLNPAWERKLGFGQEELLARPLLDIVDAADREKTANAMEQACSQDLVSFENRCYTKSGACRWLSWKCAPNRAEEVIYAVARDITENKLTEKALTDQGVRLEAANKELEAFSYSVSHDLRAPLRGINGFSTSLLQDHAAQLDEDGRHCLERILKSAQHMSQLIDDLLHLSRVTRADLCPETVDLGGLAKAIIAELREREPGRQVEFIVPDSALVPGDRALLRIAMENLFVNAWKFTSKKENARIEFGICEHDGRPAYFVRDNGAGFNMAYADKLFGAFQRMHRMEDFPGTGVGLATVQRIIRRHGGRIWAESAVEHGATFYFTLELEIEHEPAVDPARGGQSGRGGPDSARIEKELHLERGCGGA